MTLTYPDSTRAAEKEESGLRREGWHHGEPANHARQAAKVSVIGDNGQTGFPATDGKQEIVQACRG